MEHLDGPVEEPEPLKLPHFHGHYVLFVIVSLQCQSLLLKSPTPTPWVVACMWHCEQMEGQRKILNHMLCYVHKVLSLQACSEMAFCVWWLCLGSHPLSFV